MLRFLEVSVDVLSYLFFYRMDGGRGWSWRGMLATSYQVFSCVWGRVCSGARGGCHCFGVTGLLLVFADKLGFLGQISSSVQLAVGGRVFKKGICWFCSSRLLTLERDVLAEVFILFTFGCVGSHCCVTDMLFVYAG